jgi:hypothetical protein
MMSATIINPGEIPAAMAGSQLRDARERERERGASPPSCRERATASLRASAERPGSAGSSSLTYLSILPPSSQAAWLPASSMNIEARATNPDSP